MNILLQNFLILEDLLNNHDEIEKLLTEHERQIYLSELQDLLKADSELKVNKTIDDIVLFLLKTDSSKLIRNVMARAIRLSGFSDDVTRSVIRKPIEDFFRKDDDANLGLTFDLKNKQPEQINKQLEQIKDIGGKIINHIQESPDVKDSDIKDYKRKPRYLNTFFTETDEQTVIPTNQPLIVKQSYLLCVEISPIKKGHEGNNEFPDQAVDALHDKKEPISLIAVASSHDFYIKKQVQKIELPYERNSNTATFLVRPHFSGKRCLLRVEIFYRGHLLQSKRIEVYSVFEAKDVIPESLRPLQTARVTFTTTDLLSSESITLLPERAFTIDVERDERDQSVTLRVLNRVNGDEELAYHDTELQPQALGEAVAACREQIKAVIKGEKSSTQKIEGYEWIVEGNSQLLANWLPTLADVGHSLFRVLLPSNCAGGSDDTPFTMSLPPGANIQINPVAGKVTIPWAFLYDRSIALITGENRLCENYTSAEPGCPGCESFTNPLVVCPYGFWGYRYAIEQLPCWLSGELPQPIVLVRRISNGQPLLFNMNVWEKFALWKSHIDELTVSAPIKLLLAKELLELRDTWQMHGTELDVVYFYTHGGLDKRQPYLEVSNGKITSNILDAFRPKWSHNPIVFLNGCSTGDYGPDSYISLIDDFRKAGASGVIGTECAVPEIFAERYATNLFSRLFRGDRLGKAMLDLRLEFLLKMKNPLGLIYSLYASNEVILANPIINHAQNN